jgi:hypothetical protein
MLVDESKENWGPNAVLLCSRHISPPKVDDDDGALPGNRLSWRQTTMSHPLEQ